MKRLGTRPPAKMRTTKEQTPDPASSADTTSFIGIGSNIGDLEANCIRAVKEIAQDRRATLLDVSSFYITSPVSPIAQQDFINCAAAIRWTSSALELLRFLSRIEENMGRRRVAFQGPRVIDLDILLFGPIVMNTPTLTVPHPELHKRRFAILPCLDIDPDVVHPVFHKPLREFLSEIDEGQRITPAVEKRAVSSMIHVMGVELY